MWHTAGGAHWLGWCSLAGTVPKKLGSQETPGAGRRDGLQLAVTQIDSGLVRDLDCVES